MSKSRSHLLTSAAWAGGLLLFATGLPSFAYAQDQTPEEDEDAATLEEVVVTGSRIPQNEFTSPSPVQVITAEQAELRGLSDTAQFLQSSTLAAGSSQVNATLSSAFVTDGGPGAATISLRGLGANRTLVLLNGRRAGPAGTRGAVSSFDLNVIPQSAINRIDILKDGASSIYGSDAVAGVVNLITERGRDGGEMSVFATAPFEGAGEQFNVSGSFGRRFDRGHLSISADYYRQEVLRAGDRGDELICSNSYVFEPGTRVRADRIDPRTGRPQCTDQPWGLVYVYGANGSGRSGRFQYDYEGNLGSFIPERPTNPAISNQYPNAPEGFYLVNYDAASRAVVNQLSEYNARNTVIPETDRYTLFADGAYKVSDQVEAYGEFLLNRRKTHQETTRQFWNFQYTSTGLGFGGDPLTDFSGPFILSPTPITDRYDTDQTVDYARAVLGLRGDFEAGGFGKWSWDVFAQYSRSDADYSTEVILQDAVDSTSFKTASCIGTNLPVSGRPCIDVDFTDPRFLAGRFTDEEIAFLFDRETGNTVYEQTYLEGTLGGSLFDLPAGPVGASLGFHIRKDEILDTPGEVTLANNSWGLSGAGITQGDERTREVFGELLAPILSDLPFAKAVDVTLSGRYTDTKTSGDATTYKIGLNWAVSDAIRVRATRGTSFRAPALFELYLNDQTSFLDQRDIDPCIGLDIKVEDGGLSTSDPLYRNCTNPAGPGGGVPGDFPGAVESALIITGGGLGVLEPETSEASVIGVILTPPDSNLSLAVDYFDIRIDDQVTNLGAGGILLSCYTSENFPDDPVCDQFDRDPATGTITTVRDSYINIASQTNRGVDFTARWFGDFSWGSLALASQTTWTLESEIEIFTGFGTDSLGDITSPELVGNISATFSQGPWTAYWGYDWIGGQDETIERVAQGGSNFTTVDGRTVELDTEAEFTGFHSASLTYDFGGYTVMAGVANLFDEDAPAISAGASRIGNNVLSSQYTEGYYGRRGFVRLSTRF